MVLWMVESFGGSELERTFYIIALMTAPVWLAMILLPGFSPVRHLAKPFILPPCYCLILGLLLWNAFDLSLLPDKELSGFDLDTARNLVRHPITFLLLFCNWQILILVLGTMMYQKSQSNGFKVPVELLLCWVFGAWALIPFSLRLLVQGKGKR